MRNPKKSFHFQNVVLLLIFGISNMAAGRYNCSLKNFIRLGNSCYYLSSEIASWQEAHFRCRDLGAQLAVLATQYEDTTLRNYLERPECAQLGRWIGGMWTTRWIWAAQGNDIENLRGFATSAALNLPQTDQWMCLYMDPRSRYRWSNENCMVSPVPSKLSQLPVEEMVMLTVKNLFINQRQLHYLCEAPLTRLQDSATTEASYIIEQKEEEDLI